MPRFRESFHYSEEPFAAALDTTQLLLAADLAESCDARIVREDSETELGQMTLVENQKKLHHSSKD